MDGWRGGFGARGSSVVHLHLINQSNPRQMGVFVWWTHTNSIPTDSAPVRAPIPLTALFFCKVFLVVSLNPARPCADGPPAGW